MWTHLLLREIDIGGLLEVLLEDLTHVNDFLELLAAEVSDEGLQP